MRVPRSRGAVSGVLLMILGAWGALVPLIGHYFNLVVGPDKAWDLTTGRLWLSLLPGVVVFLGGLLLTLSADRASGGFGAWLALVGGVWFVIGQEMSELWNHGVSQAGPALGGTGKRVLEQLAYFDALGALIIALAAFALGRLAVRSVRDVEYARARDRDRDGVDDRDERVAPGGGAVTGDRFEHDRGTGAVDRDAETRVVEPGTTSTTTRRVD